MVENVTFSNNRTLYSDPKKQHIKTNLLQRYFLKQIFQVSAKIIEFVEILAKEKKEPTASTHSLVFKFNTFDWF